jgi:hypothetical protein
LFVKGKVTSSLGGEDPVRYFLNRWKVVHPKRDRSVLCGCHFLFLSSGRWQWLLSLVTVEVYKAHSFWR